MEKDKDAVVLHIGCGMDSRIERVGTNEHLWYDIDFPNVVSERKKYYQETDKYYMIEADVRRNGLIQFLTQNTRLLLWKVSVCIFSLRN